jgi:hypothetical protein
MFRSPLFSWSPRPGQDQSQDPFGTPATQAPSRFSALHSNIRTMINGSSIYSQSPAIPSNNNTPKVPFRGFFRRDQPDQDLSQFAYDGPRGSHDSRSPLHAQHTAGSYIGAIEPQAPETVYHRHPADVPLPPQGSNYVDPESQQLAEEVNGRRHRRKHRRRKHRQPHADRWVRRRDEPGSQGPMLFVRGSPARGKMIACIISGSMLLTVLAICKFFSPSRVARHLLTLLSRPHNRAHQPRYRPGNPHPLHHGPPHHHHLLLPLPHPPLHVDPQPPVSRKPSIPPRHDQRRRLPARPPHPRASRAR